MNDFSSRKGSSALGSGSSYSSSIEERKSRGQYFQFPEKKKKKSKTKPIEEIETKLVSTCTEEDEDDSEDTFWRKKEEVVIKSPVVYDKQTYMRFSEFSMLKHSKEQGSEYQDSLVKTDNTQKTEQTDQTEGDCSEFSSLT